MQISDKHVITLNYIVKTADGDEIDSSLSSEPITFLQGSKYMIEGLEEALYGRSEGDKFEIEIPPEKAYGERHEQLVQEVPISMFEGLDVEVGMSFRANTDQGEQSVIIVDKTKTSVTVDGNHPLSGMMLTFEVSIESVREASDEEIAHGHVHSNGHADGCDHAH